MKTKPILYPWEADADVCGESAAYGTADRLIDMTVTPLSTGLFEYDVIDGASIAHRGVALTLETAKRRSFNLAQQMFG